MRFFQRRQGEPQRSAYRVAGEHSALAARLVVAGELYEVQPVDVSTGGCSLRVPPGPLDSVGVGDTVEVRFDVAHNGVRRVFARAEVLRERDDEGGRRLALRFLDPERLFAQMDEGLWCHFNRRSNYRVIAGVGPHGPRMVHLESDGTERNEVLHDISCSGFSVRISTKDPFEYPLQAPWRATFDLGVSGGAFELQVEALHTRVVRGSRRVGFQFDPAANPALAKEQERILEFVFQQQRALLQARRGE